MPKNTKNPLVYCHFSKCACLKWS